MLFDDFIHILFGFVGIPDSLGINDGYRALTTPVQTTGDIDSHPALTGDTKLFSSLFSIIAQFQCPMLFATNPILTDVSAKE
jgi:hypothetical protein